MGHWLLKDEKSSNPGDRPNSMYQMMDADIPVDDGTTVSYFGDAWM